MRILLALCVLLCATAFANPADTYTFHSPEAQRRAVSLARELRCPQCQNQNLVESNSPMAQDLRLEVYRMVDSGLDNEEVIRRMTDRFGEFVRYDPPLNAGTLLLWLTPAVALALAGWILWRAGRRPARSPAEARAPRDDANRRIVQAQVRTLAWYADMPEVQAELAEELARTHRDVPQQPLPAAGPLGKTAMLLILAAIAIPLLWYAAHGRWQLARLQTANPDPLASLSGAAFVDAAQDRLKARIRANPRDEQAWAELAQLYLYQDEYDLALQIYERLGTLDGNSAATLAARATVLYYQAGERLTPAARQLLDQALAQDPGEVTALSMIANDHFYNGRYADAEAVWQRLLDEGRPRVNREAVVRAIQQARQLRTSLQ